MSQLRSCYFCGAVGESLREYEVVPARLAGTPDGSRSAVLCTDCQEKLRRVMNPLVERIERDGGSSAPGAPESPEPSNAPESTPTDVGATQDVTFDGVTGADSDESETERTGMVEGGAGTPDAEGRVDDVSAGPPTADDSTDDTDADSTDDATSAVPDGYYKVLRLLENREFPVERAEITALITGAYDLDEAQCERILETAVDRGILVESGSALELGRN